MTRYTAELLGLVPLKTRPRVPWWAIGGLCLAVVLGIGIGGYALRAAPSAIRTERPQPRLGLRPAAELSQEEIRPLLREHMLAVASKLTAAEGVTRDEVLAILRDAAALRKAGDHARCGEVMARLLAFGASAQRWLAEIVLTAPDEDESFLAALALREVATAETVPFLIALVRTDRPSAVLGIALELLTRFEARDAAPYVESLLFASERDPHVRALAIAYFAGLGEEALPVLARAIADASLGELRERVADGLARIGTREAGRLIYETWRTGFDATAALENLYLLRALARFDVAILREHAKAAMQDENLSRVNVFLSSLAQADRAFALEQVCEVLASDVHRAVRGQAILVLGGLGNEESQGMLLDILGRARDERDFFESANALLAQGEMRLPFERVHDLYANATDPVLRNVLGSLLAKYAERLTHDPALAMRLVEEAERGVKSPDPSQRALALQWSAQLAACTPDPAGHLVDLHSGFKGSEGDEHPAVFAGLARYGMDDRVRPLLEKSVEDEGCNLARRMMAADGLLQAGGSEQVYRVIEKTKSADATAMLVGLVLSREGRRGVGRVTALAGSIEDPARRRAVEEQVRVFSLGSGTLAGN